MFHLHTAEAEQTHTDLRGSGTPDNPYTVEPLDLNPSEEAVQPESQPEFTYLGELEVAAYSSDGKELTYSGELPVKGHTAAGALSVFKIGDTVLIDGDTYVIEDKVDEAAQ